MIRNMINETEKDKMRRNELYEEAMHRYVKEFLTKLDELQDKYRIHIGVEHQEVYGYDDDTGEPWLDHVDAYIVLNDDDEGYLGKLDTWK